MINDQRIFECWRWWLQLFDLPMQVLMVTACHRHFIMTCVVWLLVISPALTTERCSNKKYLLMHDAQCIDMKTTKMCCCMGCIPPNKNVVTSLILLRGGRIHRNGSKNECENAFSQHSSSSSSTRGRTSSLQSQLLSSTHGRRKACSFYIWNAPSALLYRWCHHLQRDNIYEGLGGKKVSFFCYTALRQGVDVVIWTKESLEHNSLDTDIHYFLVCSHSSRIDVTTIVSMQSIQCR
jgi:hypothetical protein